MTEQQKSNFDQMLLAGIWHSAAKKLIGPNAETGTYADLPGYYCIAHCFELCLKYAALKKEVDPKHLKKFDVRHSLIGLSELVESLGWEISSKTKNVLGALNANHREHGIRYSALKPESSTTIVPWSHLDAAFAELSTLTHPSRLP
ncbi:hypothetical protein [Parasphingorhabdus halotolerans]|uniref:HEPN domain-containing protein n=1 Tax=Parasphingorhabdus halotolerans TaxID=2725558 RepID=A0A6H2DHN6_9SPHN|nr:hypothetical protein [Parasphingorhabdus halotolerans]QJB68182.1 hypothetical protein HF685_01740 [Parasphingorhabdus halotolerans]